MSAQDELHPAPAPAANPAPAEPDEARAWEGVVAAWGDEAAHRAYLARFSDLDGLAQAGRRYRAVLADRPGDPVADRMRAEIVKRATVQGLASLPRTAPSSGVARRIPRWALVSAGIALASLAWAAFRALAGALGATP